MSAEHLAPVDDPKARRRCKCEFSGGGVWAKKCEFHHRLGLPSEITATPASPAATPSENSRVTHQAESLLKLFGEAGWQEDCTLMMGLLNIASWCKEANRELAEARSQLEQERESHRGWQEQALADEAALLEKLRAATAMPCAPSATAATSVWEVYNRTSSIVFESEELAQQYVAGMGAASGGGMTITKRPIHRATAPQAAPVEETVRCKCFGKWYACELHLCHVERRCMKRHESPGGQSG